MAAKRILPYNLQKKTSGLPVIPGVSQVAKSVEAALPQAAPRISQAIPCRRK